MDTKTNIKMGLLIVGIKSSKLALKGLEWVNLIPKCYHLYLIFGRN
ncbi:MAG: hypothetical protein RLZZ196_1747 [Bacteroidota bacterium]|jgi:hypothetical protein